ncbi:MAG: hypothetical protein RLZZ361_669 [Cyanobacteriota bacterium]|jgi:hypothetical protein
MQKKLGLVLYILSALVFKTPANAKNAYQKELEKREKLEKKLSTKSSRETSPELEIIKLQEDQEKNQEELKRVEEMLKNKSSNTVPLVDSSSVNLNQELTKSGNTPKYEDIKTSRENNEKNQGQEKRSKPEQGTREVKSKKSSKKEKQESKSQAVKKKTDLELKREELKANEQQALDFIFPSISNETASQTTREDFFSQTEKEQLLELWRATIARNRTIQFIIKSLSQNPNEIESNNAVMQVLSRALFVPFYAVSAVANNALVSGGSAVGARVIGDVVDNVNGQNQHNQQVTKTDMIVLFMLVDEVAERLRTAYYAYKEAKVQKELIKFELVPARMDASEASENNFTESIFFTRTVLRDLERKLRETEIALNTNKRTLAELAGQETLDSVDTLIDLEVEEILADVLGV